MSNYVTAIGLDVHARSIKACALNPMTGEVERASFGYDPASVAEWALGFESPKAVYESGVTGFHLCRALRALGLDCAVGAVSKMQRPAADRGRKTDRRDAEFLARLLATRNVVEVWVPDERTEAARDLSRALAGLATLMWTVPGGAQETGGPYMRDPRHPRHFTDEFKRQIVDLYNAGKPKREIMDEYDLGKSTVERWIKSINATGSPRAADNRTPEQNRILELERENRRLRMEVDVLKQAALIYARK